MTHLLGHVKTSCAFLVVLFFISVNLARAEDRDMVLEGLDGDVTTNEYQSFIDKLNYLPPPPTNNIDNLMVDERDGARLHGMQTFYAFTHDRRDLDMAIVWSDAFLHARNDPTNGRIIWTGKRDLCWPNKATNDGVWALHSGAENGDVIEHIVNTARLILENPAVWNQTAPAGQIRFWRDLSGSRQNVCPRMPAQRRHHHRPVVCPQHEGWLPALLSRLSGLLQILRWE